MGRTSLALRLVGVVLLFACSGPSIASAVDLMAERIYVQDGVNPNLFHRQYVVADRNTVHLIVNVGAGAMPGTYRFGNGPSSQIALTVTVNASGQIQSSSTGLGGSILSSSATQIIYQWVNITGTDNPSVLAARINSPIVHGTFNMLYSEGPPGSEHRVLNPGTVRSLGINLLAATGGPNIYEFRASIGQGETVQSSATVDFVALDPSQPTTSRYAARARYQGQTVSMGNVGVGDQLYFEQTVFAGAPPNQVVFELLIDGVWIEIGTASIGSHLAGTESWSGNNTHIEWSIAPDDIPAPTPAPTPPIVPAPTQPVGGGGPEDPIPTPRPPTSVPGDFYGGADPDLPQSEMSQEDFYNAVRKAVTDAGNDGEIPGPGQMALPEQIEGDEEPLQELADSAGDLNDSLTEAQSLTWLEGWSPAWIPTTFGVSYSIALPAVSFAGVSLPASIDLAPWSSVISGIRTVILLFLTVMFFMLVIKLFRTSV